MIFIKTEEDIKVMREGGRILAKTFEVLKEAIKPGITTEELNRIAEEFILSKGAKPSFKGYMGYPAATCISVNEIVIHGIPGSCKLKEGDIVGIDIGVYYKGYHTDAARTFTVGKVKALAKKLVQCAEKAFFEAIRVALPGRRLGEISYTIQRIVEAEGFSVVKQFTGHGIGKSLHEDPPIPNFGSPKTGIILREGMTLALEPMVNQGEWKVKVLKDGWTVITVDKKLSAHYENTIVVRKGGAEILTLE